MTSRATGNRVLIENTEDVEDVQGLVLPPLAASITKTRHSAFVRTDLERELNRLGVTAVVLAGVFTDGCIGLTAIDAWERNFAVTIAADAVASADAKQGVAMLRFLESEFGILQRSSADLWTAA